MKVGILEPTRPLRIHLWVQDLINGPGGIQAYSKHLLEALQTTLGAENIRVLSKNDAVHSKFLRGSRVKACGSWPGELRAAAFASRILWEGVTARPDLILMTHLNFSPVAFWLTKLMRIPYWCIVHGVEAWDLKCRDCVHGLRAASRIFAVSSYTRRRLLAEQRLSPERVHLLPNTFLPNIFLPGTKSEVLLRRHGLPLSKKIILTVARLAASEMYKGYDQIIRALPKILAAIPEAHYMLVGEGQDRERVERLIRSLGLSQAVTLPGSVTDTELPDYYNLCDVFAMPSKGEGFGIVYLEALSCGKPVLAGNIDGSSDPLQNGELGVLVNPDNAADIADTLISILKRTYPLPVLYRSDELRKRTIRAFGPDRFLSEVKKQLGEFQLEREQGRDFRSRKQAARCAPAQI